MKTSVRRLAPVTITLTSEQRFAVLQALGTRRSQLESMPEGATPREEQLRHLKSVMRLIDFSVE